MAGLCDDSLLRRLLVFAILGLRQAVGCDKPARFGRGHGQSGRFGCDRRKCRRAGFDRLPTAQDVLEKMVAAYHNARHV